MTSSGDDDDVTIAAGAARYRLRQLVRQHPPHDSDARHCTSLKSDVEREELERFDRQRRDRHLGRAHFYTNTTTSSSTRCRQVRVFVCFSFFFHF